MTRIYIAINNNRIQKASLVLYIEINNLINCKIKHKISRLSKSQKKNTEDIDLSKTEK